MLNISRALRAALGGSRSTTSRSRNCRRVYTGEALVLLKGFSAWSGSAEKKKRRGEDPSELAQATHDRCSRRAAKSAPHCLNDAIRP
jgi:hypothetical protein